MIIVITGASGSGKSTMARYMCSLNERMIHLNIDEVGHKVLELPHIRDLILKEFDLDGNFVDRKKLGEIVFNNQSKMDLLTKITWNAMEEYIDKFILDNKDKIIILDWILITKTKYFKNADLRILMKSSFDERMKRALKRDNISEDKFIERENATVSYDETQFDYVIENKDMKKTQGMVMMLYDKSIVSRKF